MPLAIPISDRASGIFRGNLGLEKIEPVWEEVAWGLGIYPLWDSSGHTRGGDLLGILSNRYTIHVEVAWSQGFSLREFPLGFLGCFTLGEVDFSPI